MTIKILQLSDSHLFADKHATFCDYSPFFNLKHVIDHAQQFAPFDLIISTGDIAQQAIPASYQLYLDTVADLYSPHVLLRGNHDHQIFFPKNRLTVPSQPQSIVEAPQSHPDCQIFCLESWCFILLNSQTHAGLYGELTAKTLQSLQQALFDYRHLHTLIALHHHPLDVGSLWIDQQKLINHHDFFNLLQQFPQVKLVIHGHVHQAQQQYMQHIAVLSCPSTCAQFTPNHTTFTIDHHHQAGYRILNLTTDGTWHSQIHRIHDFLADS